VRRRISFGSILLVVFLVLALVFGAIIGALIAGKEVISKSLVENAVYSKCGLKLYVGKIDVGVLSPYVKCENIALLNPSGFPEGVMFDIPRLYIKYDFDAAVNREIHIQEMDIDIRAFNLVRNKEGMMSIDAVNIAKLNRAGSRVAERIPFMIDKLHLTGGKVTYTDYTSSPPKVTQFEAHIDDNYKNVTDLYALGEQVAKVTISTSPLAGLDLGSLQTGVASVVSNGRDAIANAAIQTGGALSNAKDTMHKILQSMPVAKQKE
jgi:uncharacterized protein involved in outer membrane biogenesis